MGFNAGWPRRRGPGVPGNEAPDDGGFEQCAPESESNRNRAARRGETHEEADGADEDFETVRPARPASTGGRSSVSGASSRVASSATSGALSSSPASFSLASLAEASGVKHGASPSRSEAPDARTIDKRSRSRGGFGARRSDSDEPLTPSQVKMRAIGLLARREHSRAELQQKLKRYTSDAELITTTLDQLQAEKLLSDQRFAEGVARVRGARYGSARVAQDLRARGVSSEVAADLVADLKSSDAERAKEAWEKRFGEPPVDAAARAKQMRFLQSRGFSPDIIRRTVPRARAANPEDAED